MKRPIIVLVACMVFAAAPAIAQQAINPVPIYQLDLFSLISFGLAVAALLLSFFFGWLSWEFYKKSTEASEKSQQAVTKIETAVLNIQSEITEIVRRAVGYWTGGTTSQEAPDTSAISQKLEELSAQMTAVSGVSANKDAIEAKLAELAGLISHQREQIASWSASVADAQARAIFPGIADRGPVAETTNTVTVHTEAEMAGELLVVVLRPSRVVTVTTKFASPFDSASELHTELKDAPSGKAGSVRVTCGIGKLGDFNVHLTGIGGALVEPGTYAVSYSAKSVGASNR